MSNKHKYHDLIGCHQCGAKGDDDGPSYETNKNARNIIAGEVVRVVCECGYRTIWCGSFDEAWEKWKFLNEPNYDAEMT